MESAFLWLLVSLPFAGSIIAAVLPVYARKSAGLLAGLVAFAGVALTLWVLPYISGGSVLVTEIGWLPALGLNLQIRIDGLSWIFAFLVLVIGLLVVIYAH